MTNAVMLGWLLSVGVALGQPYEVLHSFTLGSGDGALPTAGLIQATDGNFYGTTEVGGASVLGTVFRMDTHGSVTILHSFAGTDGQYPKASLLQGTDGNLYGTTSTGGANGGQGTIFRIGTDGAFTTLHTFRGNDGANPLAGLIQGTDGDFYGTTTTGGGLLASGTVFKITAAGGFTLLHSFPTATGPPDGRNPVAGLIQATDGNFYGTTSAGGQAGFNTPAYGTIFKITSTGVFTGLHTFTGADGRSPKAGLIQGTDGNFYGTTELGGANHAGFGGDGTVFKMDAAGTVTTLHSFSRTDGRYPLGRLIQTTNGTFYGTTSSGELPANYGTVFMMTATGTVTTLHNFVVPTGYGAQAGVIQGTDGNLYGTTQLGGAGGISGVAFRLNIPEPATQADCLFNWAESNYPSLFAPAGALSSNFAPYYFRYYSQTGAYLATSSADNHVYYLGPISGNAILDVGALSTWLAAASCLAE